MVFLEGFSQGVEGTWRRKREGKETPKPQLAPTHTRYPGWSIRAQPCSSFALYPEDQSGTPARAGGHAKKPFIWNSEACPEGLKPTVGPTSQGPGSPDHANVRVPAPDWNAMLELLRKAIFSGMGRIP